MTQEKEPANRTGAADEELVDVLTAISVVSMRLARKLTVLAARRNCYSNPRKRKGVRHETV